MAILYVRDKETRKIIKIVEDFISLVWTERYQENGDFILEMPVNIDNINLFKRGRYISFDESEETMVIRTVDITESYGESETPVLKISGISVTCLLERRVIASRLTDFHKGKIDYTGIFSEVAKSVIYDDVISPVRSYWQWYHKETPPEGATEYWVEGFDYDNNDSAHNRIDSTTVSDPSRAISNFVFKNNIVSDYDVSISESYTKLCTVYDRIKSLCKRHLMGFRVIINEDDKFEFQIYSGKDRTSSQKELDPIIFNPIMDNISYVNYYEDDSNFKNSWYTYIDGYICFKKQMGTGKWIKDAPSSIFQGYVWGNLDSSSDIDRYEIPIFSDAVSARDDNITWGSVEINEDQDMTVSQGNYLALLHALEQKVTIDGQEQFEDGEYEIVMTSEGAIDPLVRYRFGIDYFMGDRVDITNNNGVVMTGIINEVVKSYDGEGVLITPNFMNMTEYDYDEDEEAIN